MHAPTATETYQLFPHFPNHKASYRFIHDWLQAIPNGSIRPNDPRFGRMLMLFRCHPFLTDKLNAGEWVKNFDVHHKGPQQHPQWFYTTNQRQHVTISWRTCAKQLSNIQQGRPFATKRYLHNRKIYALRMAIAPQIRRFRQAERKQHRGQNIDAITGQPITSQQVSVDHYPVSFIELVDRWSQRIGGLEHLSISENPTRPGWHLSDPHQCQSWQAYHAAHAHLRIIDQHTNNSHNDYGYKTP